jgi:hypothetical protein
MVNTTLENLTTRDLKTHPVWELTGTSRSGKILIQPVSELPVSSLENRVVGCQLQLADNSRVWGILGNVSLTNAMFTEHFLVLSVRRKRKWFTLARYHDVDFHQRSGIHLAEFLDKSPKEVFPITFDISSVATGTHDVLRRRVDLKPGKRLSESRRLKLALGT